VLIDLRIIVEERERMSPTETVIYTSTGVPCRNCGRGTHNGYFNVPCGSCFQGRSVRHPGSFRGKTNGNGNSNGNGNHLRRPSRIPQYPEQFILPFAVQEDFAERLARLKSENRLPSLAQVQAIIARALSTENRGDYTGNAHGGVMKTKYKPQCGGTLEDLTNMWIVSFQRLSLKQQAEVRRQIMADFYASKLTKTGRPS